MKRLLHASRADFTRKRQTGARLVCPRITGTGSYPLLDEVCTQRRTACVQTHTSPHDSEAYNHLSRAQRKRPGTTIA
ncbi:MAG: hypothetical protein DME26_06575 [Verrucomicrobia bacterium]|nr:MAG: hypothetical protein DME26_06575 [Verrucomicrobiota bacterium]